MYRPAWAPTPTKMKILQPRKAVDTSVQQIRPLIKGRGNKVKNDKLGESLKTLLIVGYCVIQRACYVNLNFKYETVLCYKKCCLMF